MQRLFKLSRISIYKTRQLYVHRIINFNTFGLNSCFLTKKGYTTHVISQKQINEAYILFKEGKVDESIELLNKFIASVPSHDTTQRASLYNNLAIIYENLNKTKEAVEMYKKSLSLNPNDPVVYHNLATLFHKKKMFDKAEDFYKRALELDGDYIECRHKLAQVYSTDPKRLDEAEHLLNKCIEEDPTFLPAYADLALLYGKQEKSEYHQQAYQVVDLLIDKCPPNDFTGYQVKAYLHSIHSRLEDAIAIYDKILELDHTHVDAYVNKAILLNTLKRKDEALQVIVEAFHIDQHNPNVLYTLTLLLEKLKRIDEAEHILREMIKSNPQNEILYSTLGMMLARNGRVNDAIKVFKEAAERNPNMQQSMEGHIQLVQQEPYREGVIQEEDFEDKAAFDLGDLGEPTKDDVPNIEKKEEEI